MNIYPKDIEPLIAPERPYTSKADTMLFRHNKERSIFQEIFKRSNNTFGFRFQAWVNYTDAGDNPHHAWGEFPSQANVIADKIDDVKQIADSYAKESNIIFGDWIST